MLAAILFNEQPDARVKCEDHGREQNGDAQRRGRTALAVATSLRLEAAILVHVGAAGCVVEESRQRVEQRPFVASQACHGAATEQHQMGHHCGGDCNELHAEKGDKRQESLGLDGLEHDREGGNSDGDPDRSFLAQVRAFNSSFSSACFSVLCDCRGVIHGFV